MIALKNTSLVTFADLPTIYLVIAPTQRLVTIVNLPIICLVNVPASLSVEMGTVHATTVDLLPICLVIALNLVKNVMEVETEPVTIVLLLVICLVIALSLNKNVVVRVIALVIRAERLVI